MALKHQHPFIDGLRNQPENRQKELHKIRQWLNSQPHIPPISDDYIYLFLHACYYHIDKTKSAIESYFTIRANSPAVFNDRDPTSKRIETISTLANLLRLPKLTPEGHRVLLYSVRDPDPTKLIFSDAIKGFCMYNDVVISEDGLVDGYVVIFDMKGVQIGHLARVSLQPLRTFMVYIQEAHPARLKAIHVVNTASWIHHIMRIILPLVKSELLNLVKFHKGNVPDEVPQEILPEDYGGEAPSVNELILETECLKMKYTEWLKETIHFRADEAKRLKKTTWWGVLTGTNNNNNNNNNNSNKFDENILKNLQID